MKKSRKHSVEVRKRAFAIWRKVGFNPWEKVRKAKEKKGSGDFYRGAFDGIPFLNEDAKRTFTHLLLRPGYMIRDYINGAHERYLAPLTSLIIFYAFFALVSSVLQPIQHDKQVPIVDTEEWEVESEWGKHMIDNIVNIVRKGYIYLHLDQYPDEVHSKNEAALATLEGTLRSHGIPLFISDFLLLWLAMSLVLKRNGQRASACAAASAYVLCQFSFFMLFAVLLTWGRSTSISTGLMLLLLVIDYKQWLDLSWKQSIGKAVSTGIFYILTAFAALLAASGLVLVIAMIQG